MVTTVLLLCALVGGFAYSEIFELSKQHTARLTGYRLYFRSIFYAVVVAFYSLLLHIVFLDWDFTREKYIQLSVFLGKTMIPGGNHDTYEILGQDAKVTILLMSMPLGVTLGHLFNLYNQRIFLDFSIPFTNFRPFYALQKIFIYRAIRYNDFEKMIAESAYYFRPILFTLKSFKIYIGWAVAAPHPSSERRMVRILPLVSGYRDQEKHELVFVNNYFEIFNIITSDHDDSLDHLDIKDFEVVFPVDQISSVHIFDFKAYRSFEAFKNKPDDENIIQETEEG